MDNIPYLQAWIYYKIKEKNKGIFININYLKEIIARTINLKGGFPKFMDKYVIDDLINLRLIKRRNYDSFRILNNERYLKKIKKIISIYY